MSQIDDLISELCPGGVGFKPLAEIASIATGVQLNRTALSDDQKYPVLNGGVEFSGRYYKYNTQADTIAVSQGGASAGHVSFVEEPFWAGAHCYVVTPIAGKVLNRYLYFVLKTAQSELQDSKQGAGIPGLARGVLGSIRIPIPSLRIQRKIVTVLDYFTRLEAELEGELEMRRRQYKYYRDALLTFGGHAGADVREKATWATISEICNVYTGGEAPDNCARNPEPDAVNKYAIYANGAEVYGYTNTYKIDQDAVTISSIGANTGTIYFRRAYFTPIIRLKVLLPKTNDVISKYLFYYLSSITISSKKSSVPNLNADDVKKLKVPIPSVERQLEIVAVLDKFDALVNDLSSGLPAEIKARRQQYQYYRNHLLTFPEAA